MTRPMNSRSFLALEGCRKARIASRRLARGQIPVASIWWPRKSSSDRPNWDLWALMMMPRATRRRNRRRRCSRCSVGEVLAMRIYHLGRQSRTEDRKQPDQ